MTEGWRLVVFFALALGVVGAVALWAALATLRLARSLPRDRPLLGAVSFWLLSRP